MQKNKDKGTIILVHGIWNDASCFKLLAKRLRNAGYVTDDRFSYTPNKGSAPLKDLAIQLKHFIDLHYTGAHKITLVGFSMGGLVCRYYLQYLGGINKINHFIALSSPQQGTVMANYLSGQSYKDMRPGSSFLQELKANEDALGQIKCSSIYYHGDTSIVPWKNMKIGHGFEQLIGWGFHGLIPYYKRTFIALTKII